MPRCRRRARELGLVSAPAAASVRCATGQCERSEAALALERHLALDDRSISAGRPAVGRALDAPRDRRGSSTSTVRRRVGERPTSSGPSSVPRSRASRKASNRWPGPLRHAPRARRSAQRAAFERCRAPRKTSDNSAFDGKLSKKCQKKQRASRRRSSSPRRRATAASCSTRLACRSRSSRPDVDEAPLPGETPAADGAAACRGQGARGRAAACERRAGHRLRPGRRLRRTRRRQARRSHRARLRSCARLSGRTVVFHTGVALVDAPSGRCQQRAGRRRQHVPHADRRARSTPTSTASSRSIAPAASSPRRSASRCSSASRATTRPRSIGLPLIALSRMLRAEGESVCDVRRLPDDAARDGTLYLVPNLLGVGAAGRRAAGAHDRHRARARATGWSKRRSPRARS